MDSATNFENVNQKVLKSSVVSTIAYTFIALGAGLLTSSQVILFDGIFNLVGVALTYLSVLAMNFIKKQDRWNYPFGKEALEPFIAITQYVIILYICATNIVSGVGVIMAGGHAVDIASGVLYGAFAAVFNLIIFLYLKRLTKRQMTAIGEVEVAQWKFSVLLSSGILAGFTLSFILGFTAWSGFTAYVDPVLTILITLFFAKSAVVSVRNCVRELLTATPDQEISGAICEKLDALQPGYDYSNRFLRLGKVGSKLVIEVDYVIEKDSQLDSITAQDRLRKQLNRQLADLPYEKWINITFTGDPKLTEHYA